MPFDAGYSPHLELLGISTVAANQSVEKVTKNALEILTASGLHHIGTRILRDELICDLHYTTHLMNHAINLALVCRSLPGAEQAAAEAGESIYLTQHCPRPASSYTFC